MASDGEVALSTWGAGDRQSNASLRNDVVLKGAGSWTPTVVALLKHLEAVGFDGAPKVVGNGFALDGRMAVTFVPGESAHPRAWPDPACQEIGALLREAHDATSTFEVPHGAQWERVWLRNVGAEDDVIIGHCDAAPWNIVGPNSWPTTLIDWDQAGPVRRLTEVAYVVWLNAQLHDDDIAEMHGLPDLATRAAQAHSIIDAYRLARRHREALLDRMIELALTSARADAIENKVTPESTEAVTAAGYPVLWSLAWRTRSAAWMIRNRRALTSAIVG